ncbi:hypothetical protein PG996_002743 [Apiospora saccharicola]|uniref:MYND-type domain-containing protein n=1 Tax=Apiospora saccharicola TaxID=335842 RepID=A0ABR1WLP8_9PEZI
MDAVEKLFRGFPDPESDERDIRDQGSSLTQAAKFHAPLAAFRHTTSVDPDHARLKKHVESAISGENSMDPNFFRQKIVELALSKSDIPDDGSAKSKLLLYHRWIGQGRKDSARPFLPTAASLQDDSSLAYLPSQLVNPYACATCGNGDAHACQGCLVTLDSQHVIFKTVYCSKECQAADWPKHKASCASLKMIGRAAFLIRDLFIMFQGFNYTDRVTGVREKEGVLYKFVATHDELAFLGKAVPQPFPKELTSSDEALRACLTEQECDEPYSTFKCVVDYFLSPICKKIDEVQVDVRNAHQPTTIINSSAVVNGMLLTHRVLQVELRSGEKVVIDLTGAQFGWQEPVSHWKPWASQRVYGKTGHLGYGNALMVKNQSNMMVGIGGGWLPKVDAFREKQVKAMLSAITDTIQTQQPGTGGSISKVLKLPNYESFRSELMTAARHALETGYAELQASKKLRLYWEASGQGGNHQVIDTTEQSEQVLEKVWLGHAEYRRHKNYTPMLQTIWARRCEDNEVVTAARRLGLRLRFTSSEGRSAGPMPGNTPANSHSFLSQFQSLDMINPDGSSISLPTNHSPGGNYTPPTSPEEIEKLLQRFLARRGA